MKRFYTKVDIISLDDAEGYTVTLDGKPVKSPSGNHVVAPNQAIAQELQREWEGQTSVIDPQSMGFMQILVTAQERITADRQLIESQIMDYLDTDLIFYYADDPPQFAVRQQAVWNPVLQWLQNELKCDLKTTTGLRPLQQDKQAHAALSSIIKQLSMYELTILSITTAETGSVALGLSMLRAGFSADAIYEAAMIDEIVKGEIYNEALYGAAPNEEKSRALLVKSLKTSEHFLKLLRTSPATAK